MITTKDLNEITHYLNSLKFIGLITNHSEINKDSRNFWLELDGNINHGYYLPDELEVLKEFLVGLAIAYNFAAKKLQSIELLD